MRKVNESTLKLHFERNNFLIKLSNISLSSYVSDFANILTIAFIFRNDFPSTLSFTSLVVGINGPSASIDVTIFEESEDKPDLLEINPKEIKRIPFTFVPSVSDIGLEIQVHCFLVSKNITITKSLFFNYSIGFSSSTFC